MADPIIVQILDTVATTVAAVPIVTELYRATTIDGLGRTGARDGLVEMLVEDEEENPEFATVGGRIGINQPVDLYIHVRPSDHASDPEPIQTTALRYEADILQAIMANPRWDDLAIDTRREPGRWFISSEDDACGRILRIVIKYRVLESNPYSP